jgi:hypothetical protein
MKILIQNAPLRIDVVCLVCQKRLALSNATEHKGAYYCSQHTRLHTEEIEKMLQSINADRLLNKENRHETI